MFIAPEEVNAEVWTQMPPELLIRDRESKWSLMHRGASAFPAFLEGPSFDRQGNLYVVDIPWGRVFRISEGREWTLVAEYDGEPNGLKIHKDGRIFIADFKNGIMILDPATGRVEPFLERSPMERFRGVNDLFFSQEGDLYFTDQGMSGLDRPTGRLFRLRSDGTLDLLLENIPGANGLVMNPAEDILYVSATRANAVWRVPVRPYVRKVGLHIQLSGSLDGPDGLAVDAVGNLIVTHAGLGTVWIFSAIGEPLLRVKTPSGLMPTNVAFGGDGNNVLFITESSSHSILRVELENPGRQMFSHQD